MKYFRILTILVFSSVITFSSCKDKEDTNIETETTQDATRQPLQVFDSPNATNAATPNPATLETAQNAQGVWHYNCAKGCAGGAGAAGNCATCGSPLAHNTAYHNDANNPTQNNTPTNPAAQTPPTPEPSQNTAGVWHYTCAQGCAGGAGSAVACSSCGSTLAHNTAYHQ